MEKPRLSFLSTVPIAVMILFLILFQISPSSAKIESESTQITNQFHWGLENWDIGPSDYFIKINEPGQVYIKKIEGYLTAGPVPNFEADDKIVRQTLASMTFPGNYLKEGQIEILQNPTTTKKFNHSLDKNIVSLNVKQTGDNNESLEICREYDKPIEIAENTLRWHIFNESYRHDDEKGSYISKDPFDALNVEIHVNITYEVRAK